MILIAVSLSDCELFLSPRAHTHTHIMHTLTSAPYTLILHTFTPPHPHHHAQLGEIPSQIKDVSEAHHPWYTPHSASHDHLTVHHMTTYSISHDHLTVHHMTTSRCIT